MGRKTVIPAEAKPRLASKARLRFDRQTERYLLLYPEKGLELNPTAVDVVRLCTGEHTLAEIVTRLADKYPKQARTAIERDTLTLLLDLADRGLIGYEA